MRLAKTLRTNAVARKWGRDIAPALRGLWAVHRTRLMQIAIVLMTIAAVVWLTYQFWRLLWQEGRLGAIDLRVLRTHVLRWASGAALYGEARTSLYPPASFVILWPLLGWLDFASLRLFWAITTLAALGWLVCLTVSASRATRPLERVFVACVPLSMYATGATIGNGQLIVLLLPALVTGILLLDHETREWWKDLLAGFLILFSLAKPSVSAPFFWIVLFVPHRLRPALLVTLGYAALTLYAASFQDAPIPSLFRDWVGNAPRRLGQAGYSDLFKWLHALGLGTWHVPLSLLMLAGLGVWTFRHRDGDPWILMGSAALVARFWTYHGWYDDLLLLIPTIAVYRIAKRGPAGDGSHVFAGLLFAASVAALIAPGGLYLFPAPLSVIYVGAQSIIWAAMFGLLLVHVHGKRDERRLLVQ